MYIFLAQTDGQLGTELWQGLRSDTHALAWVGLLQVAFLVAAWLAARLLVPRRELNSFGQYERREGAGLGKAILLYLGSLVLAAAGFFALRAASTPAKLALLSLFTNPTQLGAKWIAIFALLAPLLLALKFALPMAIFRVRIGRAFALLVLIGLLLAGAGWGLDVALGRPVEKRVLIVRDWASRRSGHGGLLKSLAAQAEEDVVFNATERVAADPAKPMAERKEAVRSLYTQLEKIRAALPEGDPAAFAEYDRKMARYVASLKQLREELAAHPETAE